MASRPSLTVAGLFAGIGGIELGLAAHGAHAELLCDSWEPAHAVLEARFDGATIVGDVCDLDALPPVDVVTAGFPCTDLSQAGRTRGITGDQSGLVGEVFRLLRRTRVPTLVLENVRNMLTLDRGRAMRYLVDELEALGYRWAYRLVDSRFTGVPQRRQRVILVAALDADPAAVLFPDDAGPPTDDRRSADVFGFYWTEGVRGLGWARDAVPTMKGGSTIGIPSPPAIWDRMGDLGARIVTPSIEDAERLQGFPAGWTAPAEAVSRRARARWRLVGNAVTVGVSKWLGGRLVRPAEPLVEASVLQDGERWPASAFGGGGKVWRVEASLWPVTLPYRHLREVVDFEAARPLSARAAAGFLARAERGSLRFVDGFLADVADHVAFMDRRV